MQQPVSPDSSTRTQRTGRTRRLWIWFATAIVLSGLAVGSFYIPVPFLYGYFPGPVRDVGKLVGVTTRAPTYPSDGRFYLTTVNVDVDMTVAEFVGAVVDPNATVVLESQVTGGASLDELKQIQEREMDVSKQHAREVALEAVDMGRAHSDGARVVRTDPRAPADGVLESGDVIVAVNGAEVETTCDVGAVVDELRIGQETGVVVERDGRRTALTLRTARNPADPTSPYFGVFMEDINYRFDSGVEVDFQTGRIAGPSAGLMFSLALYDRLTPEDLTEGRDVAGTGTIDCDGGVGAIGGIEQKVAAAESQGAEIFLAPAANAAAARRVADDIDVVSVSDFDDAIGYLGGSQ
jgi:Lon-like protease